MRLQDFLDDPTERSHAAYRDSIFSPTAPEWATGEVLLASAYRRLVLGIHDSHVDLALIPEIPPKMPQTAGGSSLWSKLLLERGGIRSPLKSGQQATAHRQLMPLVPAVARFAGVLGSKGRSRWFPGNLLVETIGAGAGPAGGLALVRRLGEALTVTKDDDLFARFLAKELDNVFPSSSPAYEGIQLSDGDLRGFRGCAAEFQRSPAERFATDLDALLPLKSTLTRRQWTVLVEAVLRLGLATHMLWTCQLNTLCWQKVLAIAGGEAVPSEAEITSSLLNAHRDRHPLIELGRDAEPMMQRIIEQYFHARLGLNILLYQLQEVGSPWPSGQTIGFDKGITLTTAGSLRSFFQHVADHAAKLAPSAPATWLRATSADLVDGDQYRREMANCDKGFTKNIWEFCRHTLGQIKAAETEHKSYDQSYLLAYLGDRKPMPVQPGPAMLILLVYACCKAQGDIPSSLEDLRQHVADYGMRAPAGELLEGRVGEDLSKLGLVVDSPDAAGGRLLVRPF